MTKPHLKGLLDPINLRGGLFYQKQQTLKNMRYIHIVGEIFKINYIFLGYYYCTYYLPAFPWFFLLLVLLLKLSI